MIVLGMAGTASLIRIMRANLLDELNKPYVVTARAMGHPEHVLLMKYPVRVALNPFVSTVGWVLPGLVSGATITAIVLNLPTSGPMLLRSLLDAGHVSGGQLHPAAVHPDGDRHADLRHPSGVARSAHPLQLRSVS